MMFYWLILYIAIFFEILATICMKLSVGFTKITPTVLTAIFYIISLILMSFTLEKIEVGTAYAIWSGLGTAGIAIIGIVWFDELASMIKFISIGLIIIGMVGLSIEGVT